MIQGLEAGRGAHIKVFPLSEGSFTIGHDKQFVPFDESTQELTDRPKGSLHVEVQPFLIAIGDDLILLDTGLGFSNSNGEMQIHENLKKLGISPKQITRVLLSHLHKDHAGGLLKENEYGVTVPAFPEAAYYVYRAEAEFALETGYPSYHPEELRPLLESNQVVWLEGNEGRIDEHITFRHSGGHSPQHIVFLIEDGDEIVFFGGDEAPQLKQMKIRYVAKYDFDGKRAMQLREQWTEEGRKAGWRFLFYHDIAIPEAKL
jgi:glyoxylase-like metal-dependent hydrolase (beta-lactamase superfamily II)